MKVICINGKPKHPMAYPIPEGIPLIAWQSNYTDYYIVDGYSIGRDGKPVYHSKDRFLPLSDIDATTLVNKKEEAYA